MIKVLDSIPCEEATVEIEPWVPMDISWWPRPLEQPHYIRVSGLRGGEIEIRLDPDSGRLFRLTVIIAPPEADYLVASFVEGGMSTGVILGLSNEHESGDDGKEDGRLASGVVSQIFEELSWSKSSEVTTLKFGSLDSKNFYRCSDVIVGAGENGLLTEVSIVNN